MGIHGNATCVMNYDGATGWLIGEENRGLNAMFTMMNEARLGVGVQGLAHVGGRLSERRRLREGPPAGPRARRREISRQAGRSDHRASRRAPHADDDARVQRGRRARLSCGPRCRATSTHRSPDEKARQAADDHMGLLTPVIKGVLTDQGFANTVLAQQVFGGHGYIAEHGMEQFVRDARIAMIYEGANGIQALDLVGRKLPKDGGRAHAGVLQRGAGLHQGARRRRDEALRRAARRGARASAAGDHVADAERDGQARQCRRRRDRLHASLRPRRARLYVVPHGGGARRPSSRQATVRPSA